MRRKLAAIVAALVAGTYSIPTDPRLDVIHHSEEEGT
jgi:hypothetical protein